MTMTLLSPGIELKEKDLTAAIARASTGRGATVGKFQWGPAFQIVQVADESDVITQLGLPDDYTFASFYSVTNFLKYANDCRVVRVVDPALAKNASPVYNYVQATISNGGTNYQVGDVVSVTAADGVYQKDLITVAGEPTGTSLLYPASGAASNTYTIGGYQIEEMTITGSAPANVSYTVDGVPASVAQGASASTTATAIAAALNAEAEYNAAAVSNVITVTYVDQSPHTQIAGFTANGITSVTAVTTAGVSAVKQVETITITNGATASGTITVDTGAVDASVAVIAGDTSAQVASKIVVAMAALSGSYESVSATGNTVSFTYVNTAPYSASSIVAGATGITSYSTINTTGVAGVSQVETLTLTGTAALVVAVGGVNVTIPVSSNAAASAALIATALDNSALYTATVLVDVITITRSVLGPLTKVADFTSNGLTGTNVIDTAGVKKTTTQIATEIAAFITGVAGYDATSVANTVQLTYTALGAQTPFASVTDDGITVSSAVDVQGTSNSVLVNNGSVTAVNAGAITKVFIPSGALVTQLELGNTDANLTGYTISVTSNAGASAVITAEIIRESNMYFPYESVADEAMAVTAIVNQMTALGLPSVYAKYPGAYGNDVSVSIISYADYIALGQTLNIPVYPTGGTEVVSKGVFANNGPQTANQYGIIVKYKGEIAETPFVVSTLNGDKDIYGASMYVPDVFSKGISQYIMASIDTWTTSSMHLVMGGGKDDSCDVGEWQLGWDLLDDPETIYVNLLFAGGAANESVADSSIIQKYIVNSVAEVRRDCIAFLSPPRDLVVGLSAPVATQNVTDWRRGVDQYGQTVADNLNVNTSFAVVDNNFKYTYDKYNDRKRWVGLSADLAGLCAYTDQVAAVWNSPAGFNRGLVKGVIKLAVDTKRAYRDKLYEANINSVVNFSGQGFVLYGDKTLQSKPSAFDRINVRRLFNMLEKAIGDSAQYKLFENNTAFTRNSFVTEVGSYLETIKAQGGVIDYYVWCDERNNTPAVIDRNEFVGTIFIKPPRSINFITLNFVATPTGANFEELLSAQF